MVKHSPEALESNTPTWYMRLKNWYALLRASGSSSSFTIGKAKAVHAPDWHAYSDQKTNDKGSMYFLSS